MNQTPVVNTSPRLCFKAILAGSLVALSIHLLLTMLGAGITAWASKPSTSDSPVQSFTIGVALSWTLSALISLWIGGYVAGKVGAPDDEESGKLHGFMVWSLATVIAFILLATGVGKALNVAGQAVAGIGKAAVEAAPSVIDKTAAVVNDYASETTPGSPPVSAAGKRELANGLKNYLMNGDAGRTPQNREALIAAVAKNRGSTPEESAKIVDEWTTSYDRTARELQDAANAAIAKAKDIADRTARATGAAAIWTFIAFWIGAITASWGGQRGALGCRGVVPVQLDPRLRTARV